MARVVSRFVRVLLCLRQRDLSNGTQRTFGVWPDPKGAILSERSKFDAELAYKVLVNSCEAFGFNHTKANLIRLGENAIYALPAERLIIRIARATADVARVRREVAVSRWLRASGVPAAATADDVLADQPVLIDGHPVTFWIYIPPAQAKPTTADLGRLLKMVHELALPAGIDLPTFDPFVDIPQRLSSAPEEVADGDIAFLRERCEELSALYKSLHFPLPTGPIHGDAHLGNLMRSPSGEVVMIDFERFSIGPREWDLSLLAGYRFNFDWVDEESYQAFVRTYGYDVASWPQWRDLMAIRELAMTSWLMQNVHVSEQTHAEFVRRLADLRNPDAKRHWQRF
jgi:Ser/Thr protein kinase RdoA (MazF antagonist)